MIPTSLISNFTIEVTYKLKLRLNQTRKTVRLNLINLKQHYDKKILNIYKFNQGDLSQLPT